MKLKLQNFNIAYGTNNNGLTVDAGDKFFALDQATQINIIAGSCFDDWDNEDFDEFDAIYDAIQNFIDNNSDNQPISMWFAI